jgi:glutamine amidotransferase
VKRVVLWDYGSGNLRSGERALARVGAQVSVGNDPADARRADGMVVPGVGAFAACVDGIERTRGGEVIRDRMTRQAPVLGICVGMQIFFDSGDEHGHTTPGLGLLRGAVRRLTADVVPHMGWNDVSPPPESVLFAGLAGHRFYFVHSYAAPSVGGPASVAWTEHGERFVAAVEQGALAATQFHPEKSGEAGLSLLANWVASLS